MVNGQAYNENNKERERVIEEQIRNEQKTVDYDTREFTTEILVKKYLDFQEDDNNEIFVPDYQREFVWDEERQSKFVESIILGLPIPLIFVAENDDGRLEIVDGSQRIRTLSAFINNELKLSRLERLTELNNLFFNDLPGSRQRKFNNRPVRMIVLSDKTTDEVKNDMFERINRGSDLLKDMEKRKGIYRGKFNDFIYNRCAKHEKFLDITPIGKHFIKRQEVEELILRYFALAERYPHYERRTGVGRFLDDYLEQKNKSFNDYEAESKWNEFTSMVDFVKKYFVYGFAKSNVPQVSRVYFEAIAVGVHLALKQNPRLTASPDKVWKIIKSKEFRIIISGKYHTHTPEKIKERVEFVRDRLLSYDA